MADDPDRSSDWRLQMGEDAHLFVFGGRFAGAAPLPQRVGVAVSGGSDSLALLHLLALAAPHVGLTIAAATVDHDLREGSGAEAAVVGRICQALGIAHETLLWRHGAVAGNLQDQARRARYALLADWAARQGLAEVMLAHTADDQAETFLIGLTRSAGLDGLTGMRPHWRHAGMRFSRPLLAQTRADLRGFLTRRGVAWMDDPSNDNDRFTRVKARKTLQALRPLGLSVEHLAATVANLAAAQRGLNWAVSEVWRRIGCESAGALQISMPELRLISPEITRRLLLAAIKWLSGADYAPRAHKIDTLAVALLQGRDATLAGCRFGITGDQLTIFREARAITDTTCPTDQLWDNRWQLSGPHAPDLIIRALGAEGVRGLKDWRDLGTPRKVLLVSPAIWRGQTLIAAPLAGFSNGWCANCSPSFASFMLSH